MIKGIQKISMIDYPGKVACTIFFGGCNFRCPFCHNYSLVLEPNQQPNIPEEEFLSFLESRKKWLDGVCLTGGEPLLSNIKPLIKKIKQKGFLVKLDTNGYMPNKLQELIDEKLLDYVAMDVKASPKKYSLACGIKININKIQESINIIRASKIDYEFRTTIVPKLHTRDDLMIIGEWLEGSKRYVLQQFRPNFGTLDPNFKKEVPYPPSKIHEFADMLKPYFDEVIVRTEDF